METLPAFLVVLGFVVLHVLMIVVRIQVPRMAKRAVQRKKSKDWETALYKAWEEYELGPNRPKRMPPQAPGRATALWKTIQAAARVMLAVFAVCLVSWVFWKEPPPFAFVA